MTLQNIWLVSDTHINHANIIKYCDRPFSDVNVMNEEIVAAWNKAVQDDDIIVHTGDFTIARRPSQLGLKTLELIASLKGRKVLVYGNHDSKHFQQHLKSLGWCVMPEILGDGFRIIHSPYKPRTRELYDDNLVTIHGHSHGSLGLNTAQRIDVGIDVFKYRPVNLTDIVSKELYYKIMHKITNLYAKEMGCLGVIFDTVVMCGELYGTTERVYCSESCWENAKGK